ncbi:MAG: SH3 domain-containing protein, partial [Campylobacterota bacterium]|nr:SH3 domain-containing protein [Campylobacterota bacterium]
MPYIILLVLAIVFTACTTKYDNTNTVPRELIDYPQSFEPYSDSYTSSKTYDTLAFEKQYFKPWHYTQAPYTLKEILWPYHSYTKGVIYGATLKPISKSWFNHIKVESNFKDFDTLHSFGLTRFFGHLRNFPTDKPLFRDPHQAGEGFPFDYNQNSGIHANEPLYLSHYSLKGDWIYVFTSYASGWLHVRNIQAIDEKQRKLWENSQHIYITVDNVPLYNKQLHYLNDARIGMMLPLISEDTTHYHTILANNFTSTSLLKTYASLNPMVFNKRNLTTIGDELIDQDYGWGGVFEDRDCSSMLRDFFIPFGIWLPRNSYQQSKIGKVISLEGLSDNEKIQKIMTEGVAFETLLYKRG